MFSTAINVLAFAASLATAASIPKRQTGITGAGSDMVTPHVSYSASIGVIGCKIDINRAAYFPVEPGCDNLCFKFTHTGSGRSINLLHVDKSGGAADISYDAWNYLVTGYHVLEDPSKATYGGGVSMSYEPVDMSNCLDILEDGATLPFISSNPDYVTERCLVNQPDSWVSKNYKLWNIGDQRCLSGINEVCTYDHSLSTQAFCPGTGSPVTPDMAVEDITVVRGQQNVADGSVAPAS